MVSVVMDRLNRYNSELNVVLWAVLLLLAALLSSR
jgi:hypothetical protein